MQLKYLLFSVYVKNTRFDDLNSHIVLLTQYSEFESPQNPITGVNLFIAFVKQLEFYYLRQLQLGNGSQIRSFLLFKSDFKAA